MPTSLDKLYAIIISFLEKEKVPYLLIGGLAVGVLGEPRMTQDIDLIIFISKSLSYKLAEKLSIKGFGVDIDAVHKDIDLKGAFRIAYQNLWVDFIVSSTDFEKSALKRKIKVALLDKTVNLPTPEDLILLKLIPGREKDILDIKTIIERHGDKLDKKYLEMWAQKLSDEAEDLRIWNSLKKLL